MCCLTLTATKTTKITATARHPDYNTALLCTYTICYNYYHYHHHHRKP
jgi:hypothetical protein